MTVRFSNLFHLLKSNVLFDLLYLVLSAKHGSLCMVIKEIRSYTLLAVIYHKKKECIFVREKLHVNATANWKYWDRLSSVLYFRVLLGFHSNGVTFDSATPTEPTFSMNDQYRAWQPFQYIAFVRVIQCTCWNFFMSG